MNKKQAETCSAEDEGHWLPVRSAALETGVSERTIYAKATKGVISQRRNEEGQIEVDCAQLRREPAIDSLSSVAKLPSPLTLEREKIEALRLQMEREEIESQLNRDRLARQLREQELEHARRMSEQERQFEQRMRTESQANEAHRLQLVAEQAQLEAQKERQLSRDLRVEGKIQVDAYDHEQAKKRCYEENCAKLESLLTVMMTSRNGFQEGQRLRLVIQFFANSYRHNLDFQSVQLNSTLAFREM